MGLEEVGHDRYPMTTKTARLMGVKLTYDDGLHGRTYDMALYVSLSGETLDGVAVEELARAVARQVVAQLLSDPAICVENTTPWGESKVSQDLAKRFRWKGTM